MDQTLLGKKAEVIANNRFKGMTGTIIELFEAEDLAMIKYDSGANSKGMFPLGDLKILEK